MADEPGWESNKIKVILVFVSTINGKVTKWDNPSVTSWSSEADQKYFSDLLKNSKLVVTGINSFLADPMQPSENHLIVVMSSHSGDYKEYEVKGKIEFSSESPVHLVRRFEKAGYGMMTVLGGPGIATCFLKEKLVDELWLTIEPKIFGSGKNLVRRSFLDVELKLNSIEKVNEEGTLILKYSITK
jgi:dihydrofolate reductase